MFHFKYHICTTAYGALAAEAEALLRGAARAEDEGALVVVVVVVLVVVVVVLLLLLLLLLLLQIMISMCIVIVTMVVLIVMMIPGRARGRQQPCHPVGYNNSNSIMVYHNGNNTNINKKMVI